MLAVGCKMGLILLLDLLTNRVVKCLSLFNDLEVEDWILHGFDDFEEFDIVYLLKTLKTSKINQQQDGKYSPTFLLLGDIDTGHKEKRSRSVNIRLKDYMVNIGKQ